MLRWTSELGQSLKAHSYKQLLFASRIAQTGTPVCPFATGYYTCKLIPLRPDPSSFKGGRSIQVSTAVRGRSIPLITPSGITVQISCLHARGISDLPMGNGPGLLHGLGDVFRAVIPAFSMSGESTIACLSCLRAMTLRSHRNMCTGQQADP